MPRPIGKISAATAAAVPPDEPPAILSGFFGFLTGPVVKLLDVIPNANSCILALAPNIASSFNNLSIVIAFVDVVLAIRALVPAVVGKFLEFILSFAIKGIPHNPPPEPDCLLRSAISADSNNKSLLKLCTAFK